MGDFLLIRKLGAGGMGVVYLAHQLSLDRPAAIKVLNPEYSKEADSVQAFIREARAAAKLNHPNIVQAYAVGEDEGIFYFAMEYLDGQTMKQILQEKGKIEPNEAARIILQTAEALDCAWREQKLIHHDIKPDNIMQCSHNRVKLADLGLSQVFGEDAGSDSDEVIGTPQYISPEQLTGAVTDTRSDIYSLGATFYHLVTGQFPYNGDNTDEIARQHVYGTLKPPIEVNPLLPRELNDIIIKMMARDPAGRFQTCEELAVALKHFLDGPPANSTRMGGLGGLSGNSERLGPTLSGGLGAASAQPKILAPTTHTKLSLKSSAIQVVPPEPTPAAAPQPQPQPAPAPEPTPEAAPQPQPAPVPKITLKRASAPSPAPAPAAATDSTPPSAEDAAPQPVPPSDAPVVPAAATEAVPVPQEPGGKSEPHDDAPGSRPGEEDTADSADPSPDTASAVSGRRRWIIVAAAAGVLLSGAAVYWLLSNGPSRPTPPPAAPGQPRTGTVQVQPAPTPRPTPQPETTPEPPPPPPLPVAVQPAAPKLSAFMSEATRLQDLSFSDESRFLGTWPQAARTLRPTDAGEQKFLDNLENRYLELDERNNVVPARQQLLQSYRQLRETQQRAAEQAAHAAKIAAAEKSANDRAEASDEGYNNDLQRKMSLLDYAMISAAKSGRPADWDAFLNAVRNARAECERVQAYPNRQTAARALEDYARQLKIAAEQGRYISELLKGNKLKGKTFSVPGVSVTVVKTGAGFMELKFNPADGKARTEKFDLRQMPPSAVRPWLDAVGQQAGRGDSYFYYMLYNGEFKDNLAFAAPDEFWRRRIRRVAEGYFRRALLLSTPAEAAKLQQTYGDWPGFKRALKTAQP